MQSQFAESSNPINLRSGGSLISLPSLSSAAESRPSGSAFHFQQAVKGSRFSDGGHIELLERHLAGIHVMVMRRTALAVADEMNKTKQRPEHNY